MNITGTVVSTTTATQIKAKSGSMYEAWQITYKDLESGEIKSIQKPSQTLTQVPGLKDALTSLVAGDKFVCTMEKDGGNWKVTALSKGELATPLPTTGTKSWGGKAAVNRDFETKEERAIRQKLIVRQSSMSAAIEYFATAKTKTEEDIFELADKINKWVWKELN